MCHAHRCAENDANSSVLRSTTKARPVGLAESADSEPSRGVSNMFHGKNLWDADEVSTCSIHMFDPSLRHWASYSPEGDDTLQSCDTLAELFGLLQSSRYVRSFLFLVAMASNLIAMASTYSI